MEFFWIWFRVNWIVTRNFPDVSSARAAIIRINWAFQNGLSLSWHLGSRNVEWKEIKREAQRPASFCCVPVLEHFYLEGQKETEVFQQRCRVELCCWGVGGGGGGVEGKERVRRRATWNEIVFHGGVPPCRILEHFRLFDICLQSKFLVTWNTLCRGEWEKRRSRVVVKCCSHWNFMTWLEAIVAVRRISLLTFLLIFIFSDLLTFYTSP